MHKIPSEARAAKSAPPSLATPTPRAIKRGAVAIIVKRGQKVLVERIAAHLRANGSSVGEVVL